MTTSKLHDLAILDAIGALDGLDLQEFRKSVESIDAATRASIGQWNAAAANLAASLPPQVPAEHVKEKLMRRIQELHAHERAIEGPQTSRFEHSEGIHSVFSEHMEWERHPVPGLWFKVLSESKRRGYVTMLMKVDPGARFPEHHHTGEEECYVISGSIMLGGKKMGPGVLHHGDENSNHGVLSTEEGALLLLVVAREDYIPPVT